MPRQTAHLTATQIKQAKPQGREYNLSDGKGLALRIKPSGGKNWIFNYYRPYTKKRTCLSFGSYPEISLKDARILRAEARTLLEQDIDPKEARDDKRRIEQTAHNNTLSAVFVQWFAVKQTQITKDYADDIRRSLENHIFPALGKVPVHKITAAKAIATLSPIAARGHLETIKRLSQRLNEIMVYATNTGLIEHNPLSGIRKAFPHPEATHMPTLAPKQLPQLMRALTTASIRITTRCLIEWQLHTMTRPSEAAGARWDEIDEESQLWTIPAERMKKRRDHFIPLTSQMLGLLAVMRPISGNGEFVFPADRHPERHTHNQTANAALKRMGFEKTLVSHGLRALASTTLNEQGFDPDIIEAALAHVDKNAVRKAYNRADYIERRRGMMCWWSDHITQAATGNMSLAGGVRTLRVVSHG